MTNKVFRGTDDLLKQLFERSAYPYPNLSSPSRVNFSIWIFCRINTAIHSDQIEPASHLVAILVHGKEGCLANVHRGVTFPLKPTIAGVMGRTHRSDPAELPENARAQLAAGRPAQRLESPASMTVARPTVSDSSGKRTKAVSLGPASPGQRLRITGEPSHIPNCRTALRSDASD